MLGLDGGLDIVADHAAAAPRGGHRTGIGIGQRDLAIRRGRDLGFHGLEPSHLLAQPLDLLLQAFRSRLGGLAFLAVSGVQVAQVAGDVLGHLLQPLLELVGREVLIAGVDRLELATVDGDQGRAEQADLPA